MMKCGPPEQAVIPSIAHSGGKVKGGGRARPRRLGLPDPYGSARAGDILAAHRGAGDMPCPACLLCVTAGRHEGDGPATDDRYCLGTFGYKKVSLIPCWVFEGKTSYIEVILN